MSLSEAILKRIAKTRQKSTPESTEDKILSNPRLQNLSKKPEIAPFVKPMKLLAFEKYFKKTPMSMAEEYDKMHPLNEKQKAYAAAYFEVYPEGNPIPFEKLLLSDDPIEGNLERFPVKEGKSLRYEVDTRGRFLATPKGEQVDFFEADEARKAGMIFEGGNSPLPIAARTSIQSEFHKNYKRNLTQAKSKAIQEAGRFTIKDFAASAGVRIAEKEGTLSNFFREVSNLLMPLTEKVGDKLVTPFLATKAHVNLQDTMLFNEKGEAKGWINKPISTTAGGVAELPTDPTKGTEKTITVYRKPDQPLTKEEGKYLYEVYTQFQELMEDKSILSKDKLKIISEIDNKFLSGFKYVGEDGIPHALNIELFAKRLGDAEKGYNHSAFDVDFSMKGRLLQENTNNKAIKYKPIMTPDELDEMIVEQFGGDDKTQEFLKRNLPSKMKEKRDRYLSNGSLGDTLKMANKVISDIGFVAGEGDADIVAEAKRIKEKIYNFAEISLKNPTLSIEELYHLSGGNPFSLSDEIADKYLAKHKDAYNFFRDELQYRREGSENHIGKLGMAIDSTIEGGIATLLAAAGTSLAPDLSIKDTRRLKDQLLNADVENYADELDGKGDLGRARQATNTTAPIAGNLLAIMFQNKMINGLVGTTPLLDTKTLKGMKYVVEKEGGIASLSRLQKAEVAAKQFSRFFLEESIQNGLAAGYGPEGYTTNDRIFDWVLGGTIGSLLKIHELKNIEGMFQTKAQDAIRAAYYLTGPKGLTYKQADKLMENMSLLELEELGAGVKQIMQPMFKKAGIYDANRFHSTLAQQSKKTLDDLEKLARDAATTSDQNLMRAILNSKTYGIKTKELIQEVSKVDEFGTVQTYHKWNKPKSMTEEEFVDYKNLLRKNLTKQHESNTRFSTIKQAREYITEQVKEATAEGNLKKYFYVHTNKSEKAPLIPKKEVTLPAYLFGIKAADTPMVKGSFKEMFNKYVDHKVKELTYKYGLISSDLIKHKKVWKIFDVKDDMGTLPSFGKLDLLRRFRTIINRVALSKDAMVRWILGDPIHGRAFTWYIENLYQGRKSIDELTLEEIQAHLEDFTRAARERYHQEYKMSVADTRKIGNPLTVSKDYLINNSYVDAIAKYPQLKTMSLESFNLLQSSPLSVPEKEIILRARKDSPHKVKNNIINIKEGEWFDLFGSSAEFKLLFKGRGKMHIAKQAEKFSLEPGAKLHQAYKTNEYTYEYKAKADGTITYHIYKTHDDVTRTVGKLEFRDMIVKEGKVEKKKGKQMRFVNLGSKDFAEVGGKVNGNPIPVEKREYISFNIEQTDYQNSIVRTLNEGDVPPVSFDNPAYFTKFRLDDTKHIPKVVGKGEEKVKAINVYQLSWLINRIKSGKLNFTEFKDRFLNHAKKVSHSYFNAVMRYPEATPEMKQQYLYAGMMNTTTLETQHALEIKFNEESYFFFQGKTREGRPGDSEGVIYAMALPNEGSVVLTPSDGTAPKEYFYRKSHKKLGGFWLYDSPDSSQSQYLGIVNLSGRKPEIWLGESHQDFTRKGGRYLFTGKAGFIKTNAKEYLHELNFKVTKGEGFAQLKKKGEEIRQLEIPKQYQQVYSAAYGKDLSPTEVHELLANPRMNPTRFLQLVVQDVMETPFAKFLDSPKNLDDLIAVRWKIGKARSYRLTRGNLTDEELAEVLNRIYKGDMEDAIEESLRFLYPEKTHFDIQDKIRAAGYSLFDKIPELEDSKAAQLLKERQERLLLFTTKDPQVVGLSEEDQQFLWKHKDFFKERASAKDIFTLSEEEEAIAKRMSQIVSDLVEKRLKDLTPTEEQKTTLSHIKQWLSKKSKDILDSKPVTRYKTRYVLTEEGKARQQALEEKIVESLTNKRKEIVEQIGNLKSKKKLNSIHEEIAFIDRVQRGQEIMREYRHQRTQGEYSLEELQEIAKSKLQGFQSTFRKDPPLTEQQRLIREQIQKSVGSSVIEVDNSGQITTHIPSKQAKANLSKNMDRIISLMNSEDAPNAAYLQQLNAIVYNPEMALETTLGHEWFHAATTMMLDQKRRMKVIHSVWEEYEDAIRKSAELNGYTKQSYAEMFPENALTEGNYNKRITEEWLAERFGEYVNHRTAPVGKLKKFFEDLWEYIRMFFGNKRALSLFEDIYEGRIRLKNTDMTDPGGIFQQANIAAPKIIAKDGKYLMSRNLKGKRLDMVLANDGKYPFASSAITAKSSPSEYGDIILTTKKKIEDFKNITIANGNMFSPNTKLLAARMAYEEEKSLLSFIPGMYKKTFADFFSDWLIKPKEETIKYYRKLDDPQVAAQIAETIYGRQVFNTNPIQENPFIYRVDTVDLSKLGSAEKYQDALLDMLSKRGNKVIMDFGTRRHEEFYNAEGVLNRQEMIDDYIRRYANDPDLEEFLVDIHNLKETYEQNLPYFEVLHTDFTLTDWDTAHVPVDLAKQYEKALKPYGIKVRPYGDASVYKDIDENFRVQLQKRTLSEEQIMEREQTSLGEIPNYGRYTYSDYTQARRDLYLAQRKYGITVDLPVKKKVKDIKETTAWQRYQWLHDNSDYQIAVGVHDDIQREINKLRQLRDEYKKTQIYQLYEQFEPLKQWRRRDKEAAEMVAIKKKKEEKKLRNSLIKEEIEDAEYDLSAYYLEMDKQKSLVPLEDLDEMIKKIDIDWGEKIRPFRTTYTDKINELKEIRASFDEKNRSFKQARKLRKRIVDDPQHPARTKYSERSKGIGKKQLQWLPKFREEHMLLKEIDELHSYFETLDGLKKQLIDGIQKQKAVAHTRDFMEEAERIAKEKKQKIRKDYELEEEDFVDEEFVEQQMKDDVEIEGDEISYEQEIKTEKSPEEIRDWKRARAKAAEKLERAKNEFQDNTPISRKDVEVYDGVAYLGGKMIILGPNARDYATSTLRSKIAAAALKKKNVNTLWEFIEEATFDELNKGKVMVYDGTNTFAWAEKDAANGYVQSKNKQRIKVMSEEEYKQKVELNIKQRLELPKHTPKKQKLNRVVASALDAEGQVAYARKYVKTLEDERKKYKLSHVGRGYSWAFTPPAIPKGEFNFRIDPRIKIQSFIDGLVPEDKILKYRKNQFFDMEADALKVRTEEGYKTPEYKVFAPYELDEYTSDLIKEYPYVAIWGRHGKVLEDYTTVLKNAGYSEVYSRMDAPINERGPVAYFKNTSITPPVIEEDAIKKAYDFIAENLEETKLTQKEITEQAGDMLRKIADDLDNSLTKC